MAVLAAAARAAAVPATPPPRSLMVTACSPLSGKRGPGPPSWASAGSSGGRSSSPSQVAKKAREEGVAFEDCGREYGLFQEWLSAREHGKEWPIPNSHGPVIPRYSPSGRRQLGVME